MTENIFHKILLSFMRHIAHLHDKKRPIRKKCRTRTKLAFFIFFTCKIIAPRALIGL